MYIGFLLLLLLSDGVSSQRGCSYQDVLNYLNLTKTNELYTMTRPVKNHTQPTEVMLDVTIYAILDVIEKEQRFVPYIWVTLFWNNQYISWKPDEFCGISEVVVPVETLWTPDISIAEMTEKDKAPPSPYLTIYNSGDIMMKNDQVMVSHCRMQIYNFPFDTQKCNLTFSSIMYSVKELHLIPMGNSTLVTEWSKMVMPSEDEWLLVDVAVVHLKHETEWDIDQITYTFSMKRRPILYIINFLLPILFFLCLDLASFFLSESRGEKLSFKVTVLLAVTVMQLVLNEILPSSSNRVPLIASYCIGIFALMLLSLLETILVMHLMEKDSPSQEEETGAGCSLSDTPSLSVANEGSSSKLTGESHGLEMISKELRELQRCMLSSKEGRKPGYWTRVAKRINTVFFICYVTAVSVFLATIFINWSRA